MDNSRWRVSLSRDIFLPRCGERSMRRDLLGLGAGLLTPHHINRAILTSLTLRPSDTVLPSTAKCGQTLLREPAGGVTPMATFNPQTFLNQVGNGKTMLKSPKKQI